MAALKKSPKPGPFDEMSKRFNHLHDLVEKLLDEWVPIMGFDSWSIHREFIPAECREHPEGIMAVSSRWEYKQISIRIFLGAMANMTEKQVEGCVVHELCHPMVSLMRNKKSKRENEERVVTELMLSFLRTKYRVADVSEFIP